MKVNANIEIDHVRRNALARLIEGKPTGRLATRIEVREYVAGCIASLVEVGATALSSVAVPATPWRPASTEDLLAIDPEDAEVLKGKEPGYIVGWNRWKRRRDK